MRVLVTGMGGELGTRVAQLLEQRDVGDRDRRASTSCRRAGACGAPSSAASIRVTATGSRDFVDDFAPTVVAHFGVYEPASRMSPAIAARAHRAVHDRRRCAAAARAGNLEYVVRAQRARGVRAAAAARSSVPDEDGAARAAHAVRAIAARRSRRSPPASRCRHGVSVVRAALRAGRRLARARARSAGCCGCRSCRSPRSSDPPFSLLHPDDACVAMVAAIDRRLRRPAQRRRRRRGDARGRRCGSAAACRCPVAPVHVGVGGAASSSFAGAAIAPARRRAAAPRLHRRRTARDRGARPRATASDAAGAPRALRVGRHRLPHPRPERSVTDTTERPNDGVCANGRDVSALNTAAYGLDPRSRVDPEPLARRDAPPRSAAATRSIPFGLDPQLCDSSAPVVEALVRVRGRRRASTLPADGPAVLRDEPRLRRSRAGRARGRGAAPCRPPPPRRRCAGGSRSSAACCAGSARSTRAADDVACVPARRSPRRGPARADVVAHRRGHAAAASHAGGHGLHGVPVAVHARRAVRHARSRRGGCASGRSSRSTVPTRPATRSARPSSPKRRAPRSTRCSPRRRVPASAPTAGPRRADPRGRTGRPTPVPVRSSVVHSPSTLGSRSGGRDARVPEVVTCRM